MVDVQERVKEGRKTTSRIGSGSERKAVRGEENGKKKKRKKKKRERRKKVAEEDEEAMIDD